MNDSKEQKKTNETQVIVVGGGPAGVAAAIASARNGAETLLIEQAGCLGGTATSGMVNRLGPFHDEKEIIVGGIPWEILENLVALGCAPKPPICSHENHDDYWIAFDPEGMKYVCEKLAEEAGVQILLYSLASEVLVEDSRLKGVVIENKSGRTGITAPVVIDATGDGDIAARSGAHYVQGRAEDGRMQSMTLMFKMHRVDCEKLNDYLQNHPDDFREKLAQGRTLGISLPTYYQTAGGDLPGGEVFYNTEHALGVDGTDALELSKAQTAARKNIWQTVEFLKKNIPGHEEAYICNTACRMGVRETRHILGEYTLTASDVLEARAFPDGIARYACYVDRALTRLDNYYLRPGTSYEIPYRCLIPKGIGNLLMAGRCFSATHEAAASARMIPSSMAMGQAAGTAAALAVKEDITPKDVDPSLLRSTLISQGVKLDNNP